MAQIVKEGYLYKTPPKDKIKNIFADKWRLRWFKLSSNKNFSYYEDINSFKAKGDISLDKVDVSDIKHSLTTEGRKWVISINVTDQNREYLLAANNKETMMSWFEALRQVLKVDYILPTEVASSNTMKREMIETSESIDLDITSTGSNRYLELKGEKLERIATEDSIFSDTPETDETPPQLENRASRVSPYETYSVDDNKEDNIEDTKDENFYMPMSMINSLDSYPTETLHSPIISVSKSLDLDVRKESIYEINDPHELDPQKELNKYVNVEIGTECDTEETQPPELLTSKSEYSEFDIQPEISEEEHNMYKLEVPKLEPKISDDIYEMMNSPHPDEPEVIRAYDHLDGMQEHLMNILAQGDEEKTRGDKHVSHSSISSDYEDIAPFTIKAGSTSDVMDTPVRFGRALTDIIDIDVFEPPKLPPKGSGLALLEEFRKTPFGNFQNLLENYWVMYVFLPSKQIVKELVNLEAPIDVLLSKLAKLFTRQKHLHDFNLYVVSDVHQTYELGRRNDKESVKNDRRLNNEMSFLKQGITSSKLLQLISIKEIDQNTYKDYVKEKNEMHTAQRFCETWIPFVRGYFSIPDLREVASLSGYIHYVYQTTFLSKSVSHSIFLPKTTRDIPECVKKVRDQSIELKDTPVETVCINFMKRLAVWPTANTIAFPIKRIGKGVLLNKQSDFLFVFASDHIGVVKADKNTDYSNFVYWWHKLDISEFQVNSQKDILIIKLTKPIEEGTCEFHIKSSMNKILCQLLENFFSEKSHPLTKRVSVGANVSKCVRKEVSDFS